MSKPAAKKPHAKAAECEVGDHVFAEHPKHGAMAVKIVSKGAHGFHGAGEDGARHKLAWDTVRGHKARKVGAYSVVDRGADGALIQDETGKRRFIAGDIPEAPAPAAAPAPDDPLTGGLSRLSKASTMTIPHGAILLLKAGTVANRPGLALVKLTDKAGHTTQRWKKTAPDEPKERREPRLDPAKPAPAGKPTPDIRANPADRLKVSDPNARQAPARKEPTVGKPAAARETPEEGKAKFLLLRNQIKKDRADGHAQIKAGSDAMAGRAKPEGRTNDKRSLQDQVMEGDVPPPKKLSAEGQAVEKLSGQPAMEAAPQLKGGSDSAGGGGGVVRHETGKGMSEGEAQASFKEEDKAAAMKHGDTVSFRHGNVQGSGKIVASGKDGVTVHDGEREHQVRHDALEGKAGSAESGAEIAPDEFNAHQYAAQHIDTTVTADQILANFPADTADKIADTNARIEAATATDVLHKKDGKWSPERSAIHAGIIRHFLSPERITAATPADGQSPTFTILGGRGGSGKSKLEGVAYDPKSAIVLDADEIKHRLPEYEGWNAALVHEESGDIFDAITASAQALGLNLVHDATMKTGHKAVNLVKGFKDAGYRCEAHYMFLPPQEAAKRAVHRFLGPTKRFVPPGVVLGNVTNEASFDQVKPLVDAWSFRDNNVAKGQEPRLVSRSAESEPDTGSTGLPGLREPKPGNGSGDAGGSPQDGSGAPGKPGGLAKASAFGHRVVLLLKAQIPGGAARDMFEAHVPVKGHTTAAGVFVPPHTAVRHKASHQSYPAAAGTVPASLGLDTSQPKAIQEQKDAMAAIDARLAAQGVSRVAPQFDVSGDAKHFYVSAIDGPRKHLVAGPYASHEAALGMVDHVRKHADSDPRAHFMAWGTAGSATPLKTPLGADWRPAASPEIGAANLDRSIAMTSNPQHSALTGASRDQGQSKEMQAITIRVAGPYTISTEGHMIMCNGKSATTVLPLQGDRNGAGELVAMFVKTGNAGANGKEDIVGLSAKQWQVHLDAVVNRRKTEREEWRNSEAGKAETARVAAERAYDLGMNEGGEGYNPHRRGDVPSYRRSAPRDRYSSETE